MENAKNLYPILVLLFLMVLMILVFLSNYQRNIFCREHNPDPN